MGADGRRGDGKQREATGQAQTLCRVCVCVCGSYTPAEPPRCVRSIVGERQFNQNTTILIAGLTVDLQQLNHEKYFLPFLLKRRVTANQKEGSSELDVNSYM